MNVLTWDWATWDQAAIGALVSLIVWILLHPFAKYRIVRALMPAFTEFALVAVLYSIWRLARELPFTHEEGALHRARQIDDIQQFLHLPSEIGLQHFVIRHESLAEFVNAYYATIHVPALVVFLFWMFIWHRDRYPHWRNGLALVTLGCLIIRFLRVAPPRFIPELGFVDLSQKLGFDVYGQPGTGISDQYAAMPSIHVAWAAVVVFGVVAVSTSRWRWLIALHLPLTILVVAATGHHWWLDGIVAIALLMAGLKLDAVVRHTVARRRTGRESVVVAA